MKPFLLAWNAGQMQVLGKTVLAFLDTKREIKNWYTPYVGTILLVADDDQTAATLAGVIRDRFPGLSFVVTPVDPRLTDGWMPKVFWDLVREPKSSGRWPDSSLETLKGTLANLYSERTDPAPPPGSLADILARGRSGKK